MNPHGQIQGQGHAGAANLPALTQSSTQTQPPVAADPTTDPAPVAAAVGDQEVEREKEDEKDPHPHFLIKYFTAPAPLARLRKNPVRVIVFTFTPEADDHEEEPTPYQREIMATRERLYACGIEDNDGFMFRISAGDLPAPDQCWGRYLTEKQLDRLFEADNELRHAIADSYLNSDKHCQQMQGLE